MYSSSCEFEYSYLHTVHPSLGNFLWMNCGRFTLDLKRYSRIPETSGRSKRNGLCERVLLIRVAIPVAHGTDDRQQFFITDLVTRFCGKATGCQKMKLTVRSSEKCGQTLSQTPHFGADYFGIGVLCMKITLFCFIYSIQSLVRCTDCPSVVKTPANAN